jgi:hypothetical protein
MAFGIGSLGAGVTALAVKQGEVGPRGDQGTRGATGAAGFDGPQGARGRRGPEVAVTHEDIYAAMEADPGRVASALSEAGIPIDPAYLPDASDGGAGGADSLSSACDENYESCVPIADDVDCASGSGDGPEYVEGPVYVIGDDIYGLDSDGNGVGCE